MAMALTREGVVAFVLSVVIGALCGVLIFLLWDEPLRVEDVPLVPVFVLWPTVVSLPYAGAALALFGLPVTWLFQRYFRRPWFGLVAAAWGGVAGSIFYRTYDFILYGGSNELAELTGIQDLGPVYGIPTGILWWLLYRRVLLKREAM